MADSASENPERRAADKERSRQLSRPVSGKEAARSVGRGSGPQGQRRRAGRGHEAQRQAGRGQDGQGQDGRTNGRPGQRPQAGRDPAPRQAGRPGQRPQAGRDPAPRQAGRPGAQRPVTRRSPARRPGGAGRSRTGLFMWGAIALVIVIVAVIVIVSQTSTTTTKGIHYTPRPVSATVLREITHVPTSAYNAVGVGTTAINRPVVDTSQKLLTLGGKPEVFGLFGEFCPYCAAERWAIITSLSRFGTFTGLKTMQSSPIDVYPKTQTFEFNTAKYTSPYIAAKLLELYGQDKPTGSHPPINTLTKQELSLIKKYDTSSATRSGAIPFSDWGNKVIFSGATYNPQPLQTLSRTTIAAGLKDPSNPVTKLILGTSNFMSASVCYIDGGKPGSVCTSSGVKAAASALKISV
jgi:hypothetical protein